MIKLIELVQYLESFANPTLQESYDNSGLNIGDLNQILTGALVSIDVTEEVVEEAIQSNANLIIAHHPVIFGGIKKITGTNYVERTIIKAIQNNIAIYSIHTNLDNVIHGVNAEICNRLDLVNCKILKPVNRILNKLVTFVPENEIDKVRDAVFKAGAGQIGNYDSCSFNMTGYGTFKAGDEANPYVGEKGKLHKENEMRFETIFPSFLKSKVIKALLKSHSYEEVAYDIYPLENTFSDVGAGMIGELKEEIDELAFLKKVKNIFQCSLIKYTELTGKNIKKVAVCGGSGSFLLKDAIRQKADIFISADFKYHQFFDAENRIIIADIGHYESEQFTKDLIYNQLIKKFPTFAVHLSKINTNPIKYL